MTLLIGALTLGFILSLLALGVFISFRIFDFPDITADGSITLGAAIAALLLVKGMNPVFASAAAFAGGFVAGTVTATLATKFKINRLLAGILVMTALYSINLHIMGKSNVALFGQRTLSSYAERFGTWVLRNQQDLNLLGWLCESGGRFHTDHGNCDRCVRGNAALHVLPDKSWSGNARHG